jgi:DNA-binding response OmpR family regulator
MSRILIAEDEERISSFIEKGLRAQGYTTTIVTDGDEALQMGRSGLFDLVLLDLGLPKRDGFTVLRAMRESGDRTPVIILTARDGVDDTVAGLEHGADDYMTKPFRFAELLARVRARLRDGGTSEATTLAAAGAELDLRTRRITVGGHDEDLTTREFALAELLFRHAGQVLSREQILSHVWGFDHDPGSNVVDVYVGYLRRKLGAQAIETVRGVGYRLVREPVEASS